VRNWRGAVIAASRRVGLGEFRRRISPASGSSNWIVATWYSIFVRIAYNTREGVKGEWSFWHHENMINKKRNEEHSYD